MRRAKGTGPAVAARSARGPLVAVVLLALVAACAQGGPRGMASLDTASAMELLIPKPARVEASASGGVFALNGACIAGTGDAAAPAAYLAEALTSGLGLSIPVDVNCAITLQVTGEDPQSEAYEVTISSHAVAVSAGGEAGLFAAAHTVRQLALLADSRGESGLPAGSIVDEPRYAYRGFMLDVARRFHSVADVTRLIDNLALYKVNVLRLHLSDDQGWRLAIDAYPALTQIGAATQTGWPVGSGGPWFYTKQDYAAIVAYAASRGITVIPEFDGPSHVNAAQLAVPTLTCDGDAPPPYIGIDVGFSLLCLADEAHTGAVRDFLTAVWSETAELTPGPYLYIGGDEAHEASATEYARYVELASAAVTAQGKRVMGWHQIAGGQLPPGAVLQFWAPTGDAGSDAVRHMLDAVADGAQVVMSPASRTYLDHKYDQSTVMGMQWAGLIDVRTAYTWDPATFIEGGGLDASDILGVEATLFTDRTFDGATPVATSTDQFVPPASYDDAMVFPRLPATMEVAWVGAGSADQWPGFAGRLTTHDVLWQRLGIDYTRTSELWD